MDIVLDGQTAYEYWMLCNDAMEYSTDDSPHQPLSAFEGRERAELNQNLLSRDADSGPLHLMVDARQVRRPSDFVAYHAWSSRNPLPERSIYQVGQGIYVVSPELCLVRLAEQTDRLTLLHRASNLLGLFAFSYWEPMRLIEREPITNVQRIRALLGQLPGTHGTRAVGRILGWLSERSRSPRESTLNVTLKMPTRAGGQALPPFEANRHIDLSDEARVLTSKAYLEGDVVWTDHKDNIRAVIEYNSDEWHYGTDQTMTDLEKIAALQRMEVPVFPITTRQFDNYDAYESILWAVRKRLGVRDRAGEQAQRRRRYTHFDLLEAERRERELLPLEKTARWQYLWPRLDIDTEKIAR